MGYSVENINRVRDSISVAIEFDEVGKNVLGCLKVLELEVMEQGRNVVELSIMEQGFDEKMIGLRGLVKVVEAKRL